MQHKRGARGAQGNRLAQEKSPYLLQHAHNPVDWYPWGPEAFDTARQENKPIFLSIGYSTCHWCHVMARESFEDVEIAALMNDAFVNVKVDKEERPDIDDVYMTACQALTGTGGWPLTIVMTPEGKPFFAETYIPNETRFGRTGMRELIPRIKEAWLTRAAQINASADSIVASIRAASPEPASEELGASVIENAYEALVSTFDELHGGFRTAPKFPTPHTLTFLLRYWKRTGSKKALKMVERTLEAMRLGGIYDHIGFGFHRYATDAAWLVPHFEKMLYDQALIGLSYIEAHKATRNEAYARTVHDVFTFVSREMTSPEGAFFAALDAESEGDEGRFYLWRADEIQRALSTEDAALVCTAFNVRTEGNFRDEETGQRSGTNILHMRKPLAALASELETSEEALRSRLDAVRSTLYTAREARIRPQRDDKILADWNGLMIAALARGARALEEPDYAAAAARAADFVLDRMRDTEGRLLHRFKENEAAFVAGLADYAFFIWGLVELYEATFEVRYLSSALELLEHTLRHFADKNEGGFYQTADYAESLIFRKKDVFDGALPSGNSAMMFNLVFLGLLTGRNHYFREASRLSRALANEVKRIPEAHTHLLSALDLALGPSGHTIVCGDMGLSETRRMLSALNTTYLPSNVNVFVPAGAREAALTAIIPETRHKKCVKGKTTAYVCSSYSCKAPTTDVGEMLIALEDRHNGGSRTAFATK
jgi:uncharacterized protein